MPDVLVVGECLVDVVERLDGSVSEHPGGSPANVAIGLARLGTGVELLTNIGDDGRGRMICAHLDDSGVELDFDCVTRAPTSTATARIDADGVATYAFTINWWLPARPSPDTFRALHTGSIAAFLEPGATDVLDLVRQAGDRLTVTYDPNARPALMGNPVAARGRVEEIVRCAHVVKVSDEDLAWLAPGEDPLAVAHRWLGFGPALVVVTRGGDGATAVNAAGEVSVPGAVVDVVDTVGAGDSFMSALLDHLARHDLLGAEALPRLRSMSVDDVTTMLRFAVRVAGITCSRPGADPPRAAELATS